MDQMLTRRRFVAGLLATGLVAARPADGQETNVVESWTGPAPGAAGVPPGWRPYETPFGRPVYDFAVVDDGGRRGLRMKSVDEHSTIAKEVKVSLAATPILRWEWKAIAFPSGVDLREWSKTDGTGHIFLVWPRFPTLVRSRLIGYVWDPILPAGTILRSRKTGTVTFIVARAGRERQGLWVSEERNVADDFRRVFGEEPEDPKAIALSIDTNDTHSSAEAVVGRLAFVARGH